MRKFLKGISIFFIVLCSILLLVCISADVPAGSIVFVVAIIMFSFCAFRLRKTEAVSKVEEAKRNYEFSFSCQHLEGLPGVIQNSNCLISMDNEYAGYFNIETLDNGIRYTINVSQVTNIAIMTESEVHQTYNKSVVGRGLVGGIMLGGLGAIIGGMSALKPSNTTVMHYYLIINAVNRDNEIKTISFAISSNFNLRVRSFVNSIQRLISQKIAQF